MSLISAGSISLDSTFNAKIKLVMQENISDKRQSKNISLSYIPWKISFFYPFETLFQDFIYMILFSFLAKKVQ